LSTLLAVWKLTPARAATSLIDTYRRRAIASFRRILGLPCPAPPASSPARLGAGPQRPPPQPPHLSAGPQRPPPQRRT
jgi:hypothetical protein